jgi:hypothetical protein
MIKLYNRSTSGVVDPLCELDAYSHYDDSTELLAVTNVYRASSYVRESSD